MLLLSFDSFFLACLSCYCCCFLFNFLFLLVFLSCIGTVFVCWALEKAGVISQIWSNVPRSSCHMIINQYTYNLLDKMRAFLTIFADNGEASFIVDCDNGDGVSR